MSTRLANPFQFLDVDRKDPGKKDMETRTEAFVEIYDPYTQVQAAEQSHRCLECGNPYCEWKCPVHNYIPDWLKLVNEGNIIAEPGSNLSICSYSSSGLLINSVSASRTINLSKGNTRW